MREAISLERERRVPGDGHASGFRDAVSRALRTVRTIIGAPDYDRYLEHMRDHHPDCDVASRDEFMRQRLETRYSKPGARCC